MKKKGVPPDVPRAGVATVRQDDFASRTSATPSTEMSSTDLSNRQIFESLLSQHRRKLTLYLVSLVRNAADAEDLCQRCSVVMWRKFEQFDQRRSFFSWACGIARLEAMNHRRATLVQPLIFKTEVVSLLAESIENVERDSQAQRLAALQQCLARLPDVEKTFLRRIYWEGCSLEAIARELGCSPKTFYNRIYLLRKKLSQCVDRRLDRD